jgi:hypothetical protein
MSDNTYVMKIKKMDLNIGRLHGNMWISSENGNVMLLKYDGKFQFLMSNVCD